MAPSYCVGAVSQTTSSPAAIGRQAAYFGHLRRFTHRKELDAAR